MYGDILIAEKDMIDAMPTISPDDVRGVGEWTNKRTIEHDGNWWCTTCGKEITIYMGKDRKDRYAFCPNCGAKMKGVSEDV
jgi:DNA-directed RNA polymerase subunit RPC12/RpoP